MATLYYDMEYRFKFIKFTSKVELNPEIISHFEGRGTGKTLTSMMRELHRKTCTQLTDLNLEKFIYLLGVGYVGYEDWRDLLSDSVLKGERSLNSYVKEMHWDVDRIVTFFKRHSESFKKFYFSEAIKKARTKDKWKNVRETTLRVTGYEHNSNNPAVVEKRSKTYELRTGYKYPGQNPEVLRIVKEKRVSRSLIRVKSLLDSNRIELVDDYKMGLCHQYEFKCAECSGLFKATLVNVPVCPHCTRRTGYKSNIELRIKRWLDEEGISSISGYRKLIKSKETGRFYEVDLYLPAEGMAIEFNGYAYHNSGLGFGEILPKSKDYHRKKTDLCLEQGVKLYHFWEDTPEPMVKSIIGSKLGILQKRYARKCDLVVGENREFFDKNHIDGDCRAFLRVSLKNEEGILCAISFRRTGRNGQVEIARFANLVGLQVVGGYSRLIKEGSRILKLLGYLELISYCNRDISPDMSDTVYSKLGFEYVGDSGPTMKYWSTKTFMLGSLDVKSNHVYPRQLFQKYKLIETLGISADCSEQEILGSLGVYPVYNSGNFKYKKDL